MERNEEFFQIFSRIMHKYYEISKKERRFGTNVTLYPSEIHMVEVIGKNPGINITEIAEALGITKGAVPKIIRKLVEKGLIDRYQQKENKKVVLCRLTDKGETAFNEHRKFHERFGKRIKDKINSLSISEADFLKYIFSEIEQHADDLLKQDYDK